MSEFDAIVIGSGMGGLACGAALAKAGLRVLLLEQHFRAGGLTQTFSRAGFTWNVGMHYLGDMGPQGGARAVLDWLCDGRIEMTSMGAVYDTIHYPDGFEIQFSRPEEALKRDLRDKFPEATSDIDAFFKMLMSATQAGKALFAQRAMPPVLEKIHGLWHQREIRHWWGRTTVEVVCDVIRNPKLQAVLLAQRGDYGDPSEASSFGMHALVMRHYMDGAYYPLGGSQVFAKSLTPVITAAGGEVRVRSRVSQLLFEHGRIAGVQLANGASLGAACVFSDAGALNTIHNLLPAEMRDSEWALEVLSFRPSVCHIGLYLGLQGDIRAHGATASNHWFYDSWALDAGVWRDPFTQSSSPGMFVSFPSLKDPQHEPGPTQRHTAEIVVMTSWEAFSRWEDSKIGSRPAEYGALKEQIESNLLAEFARHFPALAEMIICHELSTPLSTHTFTGAEHGAIYGLETSPRRFLSQSLRAKTPIPGLFLTGQDITSPGVVGAMMGGVLAASALAPRLLTHLS
jgi:all-trans-retinol 13,14-reductase